VILDARRSASTVSRFSFFLESGQKRAKI
jgi:hypothetical protein